MRRGRLLVVEDDPVNLPALVALLGSLGYTTEAVASGMEAVEACERTRFDAVLMDCDLPGMDGFKATAWIRQREGNGRRTPIVAVTAGVGLSDREKCLAAGMDDLLHKPVREEALSAALDRWLHGGPTEVPAAEHEPPPARASCLPPDHPLRALERKGLARVAAQIIDVFLQTTPQRLQDIKAASQRGPSPALGSLCHSLKGAAVQVGARQMAEVCARMQAAIRENQGRGLVFMAADLEADFGIVRIALQEESERLAEIAGPPR
jgi:CheY-like chemotaxis protein/HPt (histidine-containing phosphotransfer) domain-containing protein